MDDIQQTIPEPQPVSPPSSEVVSPPPPRRSNKRYWIISGIVLGILCLCSIVCIALVVSGANKIQSAQAPVLSVIDSYMKFMVEKDAKSADALFSPRAHRIIELSNLEKDLVGSNFAIFEGYQSLELRIFIFT